jgi:hypothetical protein
METFMRVTLSALAILIEAVSIRLFISFVDDCTDWLCRLLVREHLSVLQRPILRSAVADFTSTISTVWLDNHNSLLIWRLNIDMSTMRLTAPS